MVQYSSIQWCLLSFARDLLQGAKARREADNDNTRCEPQQLHLLFLMHDAGACDELAAHCATEHILALLIPRDNSVACWQDCSQLCKAICMPCLL